MFHMPTSSPMMKTIFGLSLLCAIAGKKMEKLSIVRPRVRNLVAKTNIRKINKELAILKRSKSKYR